MVPLCPPAKRSPTCGISPRARPTRRHPIWVALEDPEMVSGLGLHACQIGAIPYWTEHDWHAAFNHSKTLRAQRRRALNRGIKTELCVSTHLASNPRRRPCDPADRDTLTRGRTEFETDLGVPIGNHDMWSAFAEEVAAHRQLPPLGYVLSPQWK